MKTQGKLYLIPAPITDDDFDAIPKNVIERMHSIKHFVVERARTTRRFIKASGFRGNISELHIVEMDKRNPRQFSEDLLEPVFQGHDMGILSEAGMPGIADPGAVIVLLAHQLGIEVVPLIGPSSIFLALAASGMNGQQFSFLGYLPVKRPQLIKKLNELEKRIMQTGETQIFIETPYRNEALVQTIKQQLNPSIKLCIALELTGKNEYIKTKSIAGWKKAKHPDLHKKTAVFLLGR